MSLALVIDDNRQTTEALIKFLNLLDIPARAALSPSAALAILNTMVPRVVFLDINMPGLDGFEILNYLKRDPRTAKVPVIVITSDDQPETAQRASEGGAAALVVKPVMLDDLEEALRNIGMLA